MRKLFYTLAIAAFATISLQAQNLDQILKDHFKAHGQDKIAKINTMVSTYKMAIAAAGGMEVSLTIYQARPDKVRAETDMMGSKSITTYNGTTGWMLAPAMGVTEPRQMSEEEITGAMQQAQFDSPLWNYQEKGNTLELLGSSDDGSAYVVKMIQKEGEPMTLLIDKKTSLITGFTSNQQMGGTETEVRVDMKDYKTVNGIPTPHYMATKVNGELMVTMTLESIEYNQDIDPALFEKPETE
jgi:outer membrane lipoprotein-sorting protein